MFARLGIHICLRSHANLSATEQMKVLVTRQKGKRKLLITEIFSVTQNEARAKDWRKQGPVGQSQQRQRPAKELDLDLLHAVEQGTIVHKG
jgi:hypothetical protein